MSLRRAETINIKIKLGADGFDNNDSDDEEYCETDMENYFLENDFIINSNDDDSQNFHKNFVINPNHYIRILWDLTSLLFVVYQSLALPYVICFNTENNFLFVFDIIQDFYFIFDIFLNFNTGFMTINKTVNYSRKDIFIHYLTTWFVIDLLASFPYTAAFAPETYFSFDDKKLNKISALTNILRILKFAKFSRLIRVAKLMNNSILEDLIYKSSKIFGVIADLTKLLTILIILCHWFACIWYYIGLTNEVNSWLIYNNLVDEENWDKYVNSIYFICVTMVTIGFGDIFPVNNEERLFIIFVKIFSSVFFSYILSKVTVTFLKINSSQDEDTLKIINIKNLLIKKNVDKELINKVIMYLDLQFKNNSDKESFVLFDLLNNKLRKELNFFLHSKFFSNFKLIPKMPKLINLFIEKLEESIVYPKEILYKERDIPNFFYFHIEGKINMYIENIDLIVLRVKNSSIFGHIEFFGSFLRRFSLECIEYGKVCRISVQNFKSILKSLYDMSIEDYELTRNYLIEVKEKIQSNNFHGLGISCNICYQKNHLDDQCSFLLKSSIVYSLEHRDKKFRSDNNLSKLQKKITDFFHTRSEDLKKNKFYNFSFNIHEYM